MGNLERREQMHPTPSETIASMNIGDIHYLIREDENAAISFEYIDPTRRSLDYIKATRNLPEKSKVTFVGVDDAKLSIAQIGLDVPEVRWSERTSGSDEPTFIFPAIDAKKNVATTVNLHEDELTDLFLKKSGESKSASFFTVDTSEHELIGIALKREFPVMMFLTPGRDGIQLSPATGLNQFVDNVYMKLSEHLSPLQWAVDEKVFQAMAPNGPVSFTYDSSTPARKRQRDIQSRIYQIQALLLAQKAEEGQGLQDPELLDFAPFLALKEEEEKGFLSRFLASQPVAHVPMVTIDNKIWENLVSEPSGSLLTNQRASRTSVQATRPTPRPQTPVRPAPVRPEAQPSRPQAPLSSRPVIRRPEPAQQPTEKQQVLRVTRELDMNIMETMVYLRDLTLEDVNIVDITRLNTRLGGFVDEARQYLGQRRPGSPAQTLTDTAVMVKPGSISVAGIKNGDAFGFLTGSDEVSYKDKVKAAFKAWDSHLLPFYSDVTANSERKYSALRAGGQLAHKYPDIAKDLLIQLARATREHPRRAALDNVDVPELSHMILSAQVLYSLREEYLKVRRDGSAGDINAWVTFAYGMTNRWKELIPHALEERKKKLDKK